jgi:hypothetical protein
MAFISELLTTFSWVSAPTPAAREAGRSPWSKAHAWNKYQPSATPTALGNGRWIAWFDSSGTKRTPRVGMRRITMTRFTLTALLVLTGMTILAEAAEDNKPAAVAAANSGPSIAAVILSTGPEPPLAIAQRVKDLHWQHPGTSRLFIFLSFEHRGNAGVNRSAPQRPVDCLVRLERN